MQDQLTLGYGLCECGCGERTSISTVNNAGRGYVKGQPLRWLPGHANASQALTRYAVEDCGYETPCWTWTGPLQPSGYANTIMDQPSLVATSPGVLRPSRWPNPRRA